jgi:uncharacterized protein (TIGR03085 family)
VLLVPDASSLTGRERLALCDLFEELGPDAPTLCEGWTTADLAAHLVVRERDPVAAAGIRFGGFVRRVNQRAMERTRAKGFHWTIDRIRGGPPWGPLRLPMVDRAELGEWFVHHEDARRANGRPPREDIGEIDDRLWAVLRTGGRFIARQVNGVGLELRRTEAGAGAGDGAGDGDGDTAVDGDTITLRSGEPLVRMVGRPSEMLIFLTGRIDHADVELDGDPSAVAALRASRLGA